MEEDDVVSMIEEDVVSVGVGVVDVEKALMVSELVCGRLKRVCDLFWKN